jgi:2-keto-4-pentenoate hydratase/2-oxohepta-3-ene-1,7-dioic acid hydratase in catechol pathway
MKIVRYSVDGVDGWGVLEGDVVKNLPDGPFGPIRFGGSEVPIDDATFLVPTLPSKIVCVGLNYRRHAQEFGMELPKEPILFMKPATALLPHLGAIHYPPMAAQLDYEAELAVVIKSVTKDIAPRRAEAHILGYTCMNDVTARDLQKLDGQWTRSKSFDTFAPLGPWIETKFVPSDAVITARLNGVTRQESTTADLIFPVDYLVSFISRVMTLLPGDIISTGTPSGVGPMKKGDIIEVEVKGIGTLRNSVS